MIPVYKPYLNKEVLKYAHDALDSTWVSSHGKYISLAKDLLKDVNGSKYVILTNKRISVNIMIMIVSRVISCLRHYN